MHDVLRHTSKECGTSTHRNLHHYSLSLALAGLMLTGTPAVQAQEQSGAGVLEEIVVTARKREETVLDVPQSITTFSEQAITQYNIQSFADYANKIPNLSFSDGQNGRASFSASRGVTIRGVQGANTTSLYIDDTPIPVTQNPRIVDVARIEVLKGPQGTLYGSGAIGGTLRIITKQPSLQDDETKYALQAGLTEHGGSPDFGGSATTNIVLKPDTIAVRVMGFLNHDSGFVTRVYPVTDGASVMGRTRNTGEAYQYGGSVAALFKLNDVFSATFKFLAQREDYPNGWPIVYRGMTQFDPDSLTVVRKYNNPEYSHNTWYLPALTLTLTGEKWNLVSDTSFYHRDSVDSEDVSEALHDFVGGVLGYNNFGSISGGGSPTQKNFQEEIRLNVTPITNMNGVVGAYYAHEVSDNSSAVRVTPGISTAVKSDGTPYTDFAGDPITTDVYFGVTSHDVNVSKAFFTEWSYKFFNTLTVNAGVRRYWLEQTGFGDQLGYILGYMTPVHTVNAPNKSNGWSPKFSLSYQPTNTTTVYGSAAKGFRPGGGAGNTALPQCLSDLAALGISAADYAKGYHSDSVWTYELGAKQQVDNRFLITAAGFQTNWDQIQQTVSLKCGVSFTGNAGAARIRGAELEINGNLTDNLSMRLGYGYTDAKITDDAGGTTNQKVGSSLYDIPKSNATLGAYYTQPLGTHVSGFISADWSYVGSSLSTNNSTSSPAERGAYNILNARFGVRKDQDELSLYANNITDKLANYGDHIPDISENIVINGQSVPHARVTVARPLQVGLQYKHGF